MDWTEELFDAEYARVWGFPGASATAAEVAVLSRMLPAPPCRVLDVACGIGRHAIALAAKGFEVTAVDGAPPFLDLARAAASSAGVEVDFRQADIREVSLRDSDATIVLGNSFGYFSEDDNLRAMKTFAATVRPGGQVFLELLNRDRILARYEPRSSHPSADGSTTIELESAFDPIHGVNTITYRWTALDGAARQRVSKQRLYTPPELIALCTTAGLVPIAWHDGLTERAFDLHSRRLLLVAMRPKS